MAAAAGGHPQAGAQDVRGGAPAGTGNCAGSITDGTFVGVDSTASLLITPHRYADTGETAIIGTFRADTAPMIAAVVKASGITA